MVVFPNAKINIGLRIVARRTDGYHDIETVFLPVDLHDALEFVINPTDHKDDLMVTGIDLAQDVNENLVIKAVAKLREIKPYPFLRIHLHKTIPAGAGLGGGSADAASLLKSVNRFFSLGIEEEQIKAVALEIGSDCPFFIDNLPSYATGRGEKLVRVNPPVSDLYIILLNPKVHVSTREAYAACKPALPETSLLELIQLPVAEWKNSIFNDFEEYAFSRHPVIAEMKRSLYESGALFSLMSGSGSTVFGLFGKKPAIPDHLREYVIYEGKACS